MATNKDITSPYYPYFKVQEGYFDFGGYSTFPKKICDYLLDAPKGEYQPIDDNKYPRTRLWKYLYYDGEKPIEKSLPTIAQKMSVLFNPEKASEPPTDKDYRLIPQQYIKQSQEKAITRIYVYMGRSVATDNNNIFNASVVFDVLTHYTYELNMKTDEYSRSGAIISAIMEALNGVCIEGVGTFRFNRAVHPDCGTRPIFDGETNVGQELTIGLEMSTVAPDRENQFNNLPSGGKNIRLA